MIELERHIEILLLSNDCVIVPNFGGFMAHHVDARYDDEDGFERVHDRMHALGIGYNLKF